MQIGLVANSRKAQAPETVARVREVFAGDAVSIVLEADTARMMGEEPPESFTAGSDLILSLGGDGTLLETLRRMEGADIPVAGINIGTLGFLTTCQDEQLEAFAEAVRANTITIVERSMLRVEVTDTSAKDHVLLAVNEVVIARGETGRMVNLEARVDDELLHEYKADGLIVATPTGSTAYSLSAGGPLIGPNAEVFVITPICPHSLSDRSLIVTDDSRVTVQPCGDKSEPILFTVDGRDVLRLAPQSTVVVTRAESCMRLVRMPDHSFYETLRRKLHWHGG